MVFHTQSVESEDDVPQNIGQQPIRMVPTRPGSAVFFKKKRDVAFAVTDKMDIGLSCLEENCVLQEFPYSI